MAKCPDIKIKSLTPNSFLRVKVIITTEFKIRQFIAIKLIKLATKILRCSFVFDDGDNKN